MKKETIAIGLILASLIGAGVYAQTIGNSQNEYTFDPGLKVWTNAGKDQIDLRALTCNYSKISETARIVKFGQYKENVWTVSNSNIMISVVGAQSETLSAYMVMIDGKNKATLKEVK